MKNLPLKKVHIILLIICIPILIVSFGIFFRASGTTLVFEGINIQSLRDKFSEVHFIGKGNDFAGSIFWLASKSLSGTVTINDRTSSKECNKLVRGLYYNSQRGNRIRPLDQESLNLLKGINPNYDDLTIAGGRYTNCIGDPYSMYGKISYSRGNIDSDLMVGLKLDYTANNFDHSGYGGGTTGTFAKSLQYFDNKTPIGFFRDSIGGIGFAGGTLYDYESVITQINNGLSIVSGFVYSGNSIVISGQSLFTSTGLNSASNTLWNLIIQGTIGLSQSLNEQERIGIMGNPQAKTVIYNNVEISNADVINEVATNVEKLCKGKTRRTDAANIPNTTEKILCLKDTNLTIDLENHASLWAGKTIILRGVSVILDGSMTANQAPLEIFIDDGNLYLNNTITNMQDFNIQGYPGGGDIANQGMFLKGIFLINGLILGRNTITGNPQSFPHKLHIQGKVLSFNSPLDPAQGRKDLVENLLGIDYIPWINLQNVLTRECGLGGTGSDGTPCGGTGDISRSPLVILDSNFPSKLLGQ